MMSMSAATATSTESYNQMLRDERRAIALQHAVNLGGSEQTVLMRARKFEGFLTDRGPDLAIELHIDELLAVAESRVAELTASIAGDFGRTPIKERMRAALASVSEAIAAVIASIPSPDIEAKAQGGAIGAQQADRPFGGAQGQTVTPIKTHSVPIVPHVPTQIGMCVIREDTLVETLKMAGYGIISPTGQRIA